MSVKLSKKVMLRIMLIIGIIIIGFIAYECIGYIVNNSVANKQTEEFTQGLVNQYSDAKILETASGVENIYQFDCHAHIVTEVVFEVNVPFEQVEKVLIEKYNSDKSKIFVDNMKEDPKKDYGITFSTSYSRLELSSDSTNCYYLILIRPAPFEENFEGYIDKHDHVNFD